MPARLITADDLQTAQFEQVADAWAIANGALTRSSAMIKATEDIEAGDFVNIYDNGGSTEMRLAIASDPTLGATAFVLADITAGGNGRAFFAGLNTAAPVLTTITEVYLNDSVGGKAAAIKPTTSGHIIQPLGVAIATVGIFFMPQTKLLIP